MSPVFHNVQAKLLYQLLLYLQALHLQDTDLFLPHEQLPAFRLLFWELTDKIHLSRPRLFHKFPDLLMYNSVFRVQRPVKIRPVHLIQQS